MPRTWFLCGIPRSGNGLCCRLAGGLPDTVALSQPLNPHYPFGGVPFGNIPREPRGACARLGEFAGKVREQILAEARAPSHQVGGGLYDNIMASERDARTGLRECQGEWGVVEIDKPLSERFTLLVSQPAMFSALLPDLAVSFSCLALVRNPLPVLASWQTVNLPFNRGRIAGAEPYDAELRRTLDGKPELMQRQLTILERFFARYDAHVDPRHIIRYEGTELYGYLSEPALRICVSWEVAQAILATGRTRGPVLTIPNGIDITPFEASERGSPAGFQARRWPVLLAGYKRPDLARGLSERLDAQRTEHRLLTEFLGRDAFLGLLAESRVAVCPPHAEEGFYLPALEAMASGAAVVTLDCIGNRGFCHDHWNCIIAKPDPGSLFRAVRRVLAMSASEHGRMHRRARDTVARHSLKVERRRFHSVLRDIDRLWRTADILPTQGL